MAFSMHSHSGQFCPGHAKDQLEAIIQTAIARGFKTFALTEHMPRNSEKDLYPEEVYPPLLRTVQETDLILQIAASSTCEALFPNHEAYIKEAVRLREIYANQITILIGFEGEYIRSAYGDLIKELASNEHVDFFIGSVHHVHEIPIDYDSTMYQQAREKAGGSDEQLFSDYFDLQYEMLRTLRPKVVGHFDLIRLLSEEPDRDLKKWKTVWEKIERNLKVVVEQGGLLEINTSALRKELKQPYPRKEICEVFLGLGGKLTLSDDSHGIAQVGTNYEKAFTFLEGSGVREVWTLVGKRNIAVSGETMKSVSLKEIKDSFCP